MINSSNFIRIRIGTSKPALDIDLADYVLMPLTNDEKDKIYEGVTKAEDAIAEIIKNGCDKAMNLYNLGE